MGSTGPAALRSRGRQLMVAITTISLLSAVLPQPARANSTSHLVVRGTITGVTVNPNLSLTLGVDRKMSVYVGSNPTWENVWDSAEARPPQFAVELRQFTGAGYRWDGWYLRPPGS